MQRGTYIEVSLFMSIDDRSLGISEDSEKLRSSEPPSVFEFIVEVETDRLGGGGDSETADPERKR